jgi:hypothetical protein
VFLSPAAVSALGVLWRGTMNSRGTHLSESRLCSMHMYVILPWARNTKANKPKSIHCVICYTAWHCQCTCIPAGIRCHTLPHTPLDILGQHGRCEYLQGPARRQQMANVSHRLDIPAQ